MRSARTVLLVDDNEYDVVLMRHAFAAGEFQFPVQEGTGGEKTLRQFVPMDHFPTQNGLVTR